MAEITISRYSRFREIISRFGQKNSRFAADGNSPASACFQSEFP